MAKLDELAELLTEEIKGFQNSVDRMEQLQKFLMEYKVQADISGIDFILKRYNDHQKKAIEDQHRLMENVLQYIKKSMTIPKWSIKLFWSLLIIVFLVLGYSMYQVSRIPEREQIVFKKGEDEAVAHFRAFFDANPEAGKLYKEWIKPKIKK